MRNIEKGFLLAEIMSFDTINEKDVKSFISWIRSQECYDSLFQRVKELKTSTSFYARYLYNEFISIDLERVKTIEEGFIAYAKILYLHQIITPGFYINPMLVINKQERNYKIGEIVVYFNNKYMTLNELNNDENYSFQEKYEFILKQVNKWQKDIEEKILYPMSKLSDNPRNLPKVRIIPFSYLLTLLLYVAMITLSIFIPLNIIPALKDVLLNFNISSYNELNYFYLASLCVGVIGFIILIVEIFIRRINYGHYFKYHKVILGGKDKALKVINESKNNLEKYLVSSFDKKSELKAKVFTFSKCYFLFEYIMYLYEINYHYKKITKDRISLINKILFAFSMIFFALFLIFALVHKIGGLL